MSGVMLRNVVVGVAVVLVPRVILRKVVVEVVKVGW